MFQDISPYHYDNTFHEYAAEAEDMAVLVRDRRILLKEENGEIIFPKIGDIRPQETVYLFSISELRFHMAIADDAELLERGYSYYGTYELTFRKPRHLAFAANEAVSLYCWYRDNRYCGRCGGLNLRDHSERMLYCENCHTAIYPRINPCVIAAVTNGDRIVLTQAKGRNRHYALVSGFCETGESAEDTVRREVYEEVGLRVKNIRFYKSQQWPHSDSLLFGFWCELDGDDTITVQKSELSDAKWFRREQVEERDLSSLTAEMMYLFRNRKEKPSEDDR